MTPRPAPVQLTHDQKHALCEHHTAHPELSRRQLCEWATTEFLLPRQLARTTLADMLAQPELAPVFGLSRKASHAAHCTLLVERLLAWKSRCELWKFSAVPGAAMRGKAEKIRRELLREAATSIDTKLVRMEFSKGWLHRFQGRHGLKSRRVHGEAGPVNAVAVEEGQAMLQQATCDYTKRDILNMDETVYFYCTMPVMGPHGHYTKVDLCGTHHLVVRHG